MRASGMAGNITYSTVSNYILAGLETLSIELTATRGLVEATKPQRPLKLIYFEGCLSKEMVILREKQLKTDFGRKWPKKRLKM